MDTKISVGDAMTKDVVIAKPADKASKVANKMFKHRIGCVIVVDKGPIGIVTEGDIVQMVAENGDPNKTKVKEMMSTPLIYADPDIDIIEASRQMAKYDIRRLTVLKNGKLVGVVTAKDILKVAPEKEDILSELANIHISEVEAIADTNFIAGECEACGSFSEFLSNIDGKLICPECKAEQEG